MSKTLGWLAVGCAIVVAAGLIFAAATRAWFAPETNAREVAALTEQLSQLEASQQAVSDQHTELTGQMTALQDQIGALAYTLGMLAEQQSDAKAPDSALDERQLAAMGEFVYEDATLEEAEAVPRSLRGIATIPGQVLVYEVTGTKQGSVWGTDVYTDDSSIAVAAVHAGLLQPDETGTIMVTILEGRDSYWGSVRNGVPSKDYPNWERSYALQRIQ